MAMLIAFGTGASLAGCGNQNSVPYDPDKFIEDVTNPQIVKEPVTITFYVPKHSLHVDYEDMRVFKEVSAITNINMKFEQADWEAYAEIRSLRWEDDSSLPDAFMFCNNLDEQVQYSSLGQLAPIDDLIDQYCPNYKALMEKYPEIEQVSRLTDGNIYSFTTVNTVPNTCSMPNGWKISGCRCPRPWRSSGTYWRRSRREIPITTAWRMKFRFVQNSIIPVCLFSARSDM